MNGILSPVPLRMPALALALTVAGIVALTAACASTTPAVTPSPALTATAALSPTVPPTVAPTDAPITVPTDVPIARPTQTPSLPAIHPAGARTGIAHVDSVIGAFLSTSVEARRALVRFLTTPCTTARGLGGPPKCADGQADGTPVEVFPYQTGEGGYATRATIDRALTFDVSGLYGVFRVPVPAVRYDYWPIGDYAIVFTREPGLWARIAPVLQVIVHVENGAVVMMTNTPYIAEWPPAEAAGASWLLAPLP